MWDVIPQPGLASAVVDFTNELSLLTVSLLGLVGLSAGMIILLALRHYRAQRTQPAAQTAPAPADRRKAA